MVDSIFFEQNISSRADFLPVIFDKPIQYNVSSMTSPKDFKITVLRKYFTVP
jgi:hypothetical protein